MSENDNVQVTVQAGTLKFELGTYQKGEQFIVSRERAKQFRSYDVEVSELPKPIIESPVSLTVESPKEVAPIKKSVRKTPSLSSVSAPITCEKNSSDALVASNSTQTE